MEFRVFDMVKIRFGNIWEMFFRKSGFLKIEDGDIFLFVWRIEKEEF